MVVQCTWKPTEGRDINDALSWVIADEVPKNDVEEEVQAENCLLLVAPSDMSSEFLGAPACQLLISCHPMQRIKCISVLSDARVMEVYGHHGEYLKTIKNELLEEVEDMAVFKGDIQLDKALNVCSIKFVCLRSKTEMWLYGVKVSIINVPDEENAQQISYTEVERRLSEMGMPLSDKAKIFKELVESNPGLPGLQNPDMNAFINLFKTFAASKESLNLEIVNNNQNDAKVNDFPNMNGAIKSEANGELLNGINNNDDNNNNSVELIDISTQTLDPPPPSVEDIIKLHIDDKIEELEKYLSEKIEKCFKEIETKLFCKLDEIESFVKPHGA